MNKIFSCYFTTKKDPQRDRFWNGDDIGVIKEWYESVERLDLEAVIFHDHCSDDFIRKLSTDKISFTHYKPIGDIMNAKWKCMKYYLSDHPLIRNLFITDISDVVIMKDPFNLIEGDELICGSEEETIGKSKFMRESQRRIFNKLMYKDNMMLNCGIVGGRRDTVIQLLDEMIKLFTKTGNRIHSDMVVFNQAVYDNRIKVLAGSRVHSKFYAEENEGEFYFKHK